MNIYIGCDVKVKYVDIYYYHEIPKCPLGFSEIKKVDILWKDQSKVLNSLNASGELYLRVTMASNNDTVHSGVH
jgi:hypothetical protein